ncbi:MAG: WD40 repeat domain-containing protein, partial [Deltaproteobacteria bacterium]|nr:WD40 repeat domain-containing protein [Deltaproteobacteria bacterium]
MVAPVRVDGKWSVAEDGRIIWDRRLVQVWNLMFSPDGSKLAAIVAPKYGKWTVAVDGQPWAATFNDIVSDAVFSPDSNRIAAVAKN